MRAYRTLVTARSSASGEFPPIHIAINHHGTRFHSQLLLTFSVIDHTNLITMFTSRAVASSSRTVVIIGRSLPRPVASRLTPGSLQRTRPTQRSFATEASSERFDPLTIERDSDEVDVCIVGGGPAGLSAAIRLKQLEAEHGREIRVVVLEKGAEIGELARWLRPLQLTVRLAYPLGCRD